MRSTVSYNAVYFIITKAYGFLGKKKPQGRHVPFALYRHFS